MLLLTTLIKWAENAHVLERGQQRLQLPRESVEKLQAAADKMWYQQGGRNKLHGTDYYSPLQDPNHNTVGYVGFRKVGNPGRNRLILTTILAKHMRPKGDNIGSFFDSAVQGIYPVSPNELKPFPGMPKVPNNTKAV